MIYLKFFIIFDVFILNLDINFFHIYNFSRAFQVELHLNNLKFSNNFFSS